MSTMTELARRLKGRPVRGVELAQVVSAEPLTLDIGGVVYSSRDWRMYAPAYAMAEMSLDNVLVLHPSVQCAATGAAVSGMGCEAIAAAEVEAQARWAPGDVLAVQELEGSTFVILCKLEEVR